jgi:hypothetical protein
VSRGMVGDGGGELGVGSWARVGEGGIGVKGSGSARGWRVCVYLVVRAEVAPLRSSLAWWRGTMKLGYEGLCYRSYIIMLSSRSSLCIGYSSCSCSCLSMRSWLTISILYWYENQRRLGCL